MGFACPDCGTVAACSSLSAVSWLIAICFDHRATFGGLTRSSACRILAGGVITDSRIIADGVNAGVNARFRVSCHCDWLLVRIYLHAGRCADRTSLLASTDSGGFCFIDGSWSFPARTSRPRPLPHASFAL